MESKNIKIVDQNGIDRVANVICSIDVDGSDYVIYWIERDNDNDNLFVSKLLRNNDGTSTMANIDNADEKANMNEIVKELITHAVKDENDCIAGNSLTLKNGKNIKIANVLFNKEQSIDIQKTYITTVQKASTVVSEKYFHVEKEPEVVKVDTPVVPEPVPEVSPVAMPSIEEVVQPVSEPEVVVPEVPVLEVPVQQEVTPVSIPNLEIQNNVAEPVTVQIPNIQNNVVPPVVDTIEPVVSNVIPEVTQPVVEEPNIEARMNIIGANPAPTPEPPVVSVPEVPEVSAAAVSPMPPVPEVPVAAPAPVSNGDASNELFFDGSKETNLAGVFEGNSDDTQPIVATQTVSPIREFGQDEPVIPIVNDVTPAVQEQPKTLTKSPGFANNKFFLVIALTFFIASCVFLGYEVFKYVQMR